MSGYTFLSNAVDWRVLLEELYSSADVVLNSHKSLKFSLVLLFIYECMRLICLNAEFSVVSDSRELFVTCR